MAVVAAAGADAVAVVAVVERSSEECKKTYYMDRGDLVRVIGGRAR